MKREAGHLDIASLAICLAGEGDAEDATRLHCITAVCLVKVTYTEEEYRIAVGSLQVVELHH